MTKVYITRDEGTEDRFICLWLKPERGNFSPSKIKDCEWVIWERPGAMSLDLCHIYTTEDFKKKFGITIKPKEIRLVDLPEKLINNEDFKLFSKDSKRRKE